MREQSPKVIRDVAARLSQPVVEESVGRRHSAPEVAMHAARSRTVEDDFSSQHFDIFARADRAKSPSWAIWWSDLMMTMFILFAALFAFQMPKVQFKSVSDLPVRTESVPVASDPKPMAEGSILDRIHDQLRDAIEQGGMESQFALRLVPEKAVHVTLRTEGLFDAGTSVVRADVKNSLLRLTGILRSAPFVLAVVGHAAPGEELRGHAGLWELSVARAADVAGVLMRDGRLPAERMMVIGFGDQRPLKGESARSRRVELVLSTENPMEPLPEVEGQGADGFRRWVATAREGEQ